MTRNRWGAAPIPEPQGTNPPGPKTTNIEHKVRVLKPAGIGDTPRIAATVIAREVHKKRVRMDCQIIDQAGALAHRYRLERP